MQSKAAIETLHAAAGRAPRRSFGDPGLRRPAGGRGLARAVAAAALLLAVSAHAADTAAPRLLRLHADGTIAEASRGGRLRGEALPVPSDTTLVFSFDFEDRHGNCVPRGWTVEDYVTRVYAHVSSRFVTNTGPVAMGTRAVWFGADSSSAPDEVARWPFSYGYGNRWSQRLVSPEFSLAAHPQAVLTFDATLAFKPAGNPVVLLTGNEFLAVQGRRADGTWAFLTTRFTPVGGATIVAATLRNRGTVEGEVRLGADGNESLGLGATTRLRLVVQTNGDSSQADGSIDPVPGAAAVVDNLRLDDGLGGDLVPLVDCEDGTTGPWTLSAVNTAVTLNTLNFTRDAPPPATSPALRRGFDFADPSCVWTFLSPGDTLARGTLARITSPWMPLADRFADFAVAMATKLNLADSRRFLYLEVQGKQAGDSRPRVVARPRTVLFVGGSAPDVNSPLIDDELHYYPNDFHREPTPAALDSVRLVIEVHDRGEGTGQFDGRPQTRLPFFDRIRVLQFEVDSDHDGVPDAADACPDQSAAGEDADGDGCLDPTASLRHAESWPLAGRPIRFRLSQDGAPGIEDGSDLAAIRAAFATWAGVSGAAVPLLEDSLTAETDASALDGVNLVTFADDLGLPANVIAVTPTTSFTRRSSFLDRVVLPGEIVDADILLNPASTFNTATHTITGGHDLQAVMTHEVGHLIGLSHSGVEDATLFPLLQPGTEARTLEDDDRAAAAAAYPGPTLATAFGAIRGRVLRGGTAAPVPGALVIGVHLVSGVPADSAASDFTREDGSYALRRLAPGDYAVRIAALDGSVPGLVPAAIHDHLAAIAETNFPPEWWSVPESGSDDTGLFTSIAVAAGQVRDSIDLVTTIDVTPPEVASVTPADQSAGIRIDTAIRVSFSETVEPSTLDSAFKLRKVGAPQTLGARGRLLAPGHTAILTPDDPLEFGSSYQLVITTALRDRSGLALAAPDTTRFATEPAPVVAITSIQPRPAARGALVTVAGAGFVAGNPAAHQVRFAAAAPVAPLQASPHALVARVPDDAASGDVRVVVSGDTSNALAFTVLPTGARTAPVASGEPIATPFAPHDVAVAPDGRAVFASGESGVARIRLVPDPPADHRVARLTLLDGARRLALSPDGSRLFATRPDHGDVVELAADPDDGDFGLARDTIPLAGTPEGIVVNGAGTRAYVSEQSGERIFEIDLAPGPTHLAVLGELRVPGGLLSGGLAFDPASGRVVATTTTHGLVALHPRDTTVAILAAGRCADNAAVTPAGREVFATPSAEVGSPPLLFARLPGGAAGTFAAGGTPRDVLVHPDGRSLLVVNSMLHRLQVVDVADTAAATYHAAVADVATGLTPVAVAASHDGALIAVANSAGASVSLYTVGAEASLVLVTPPVAGPGERVAVREAGGAIRPFTAADLGEGSFAILEAASPDSFAAGIAIPSLSQRDTRLALAIPPGSRTLGLPFQILDPIASFHPAATGLDAGTLRAFCAGESAYRPLEHLRVSPEGSLLAIVSGAPAPACSAALDLVQAREAGPGQVGSRLLSLGIDALGAYDAAFTADGKELWLALMRPAGGTELRRLSSDPASPQFGASLGTVSGAVAGEARALAADPAGRWVAALAPAEGRLTRVTPAGAALDTAAFPPGLLAGPMAASPDGALLVVAGSDRAWFYRTRSSSLALAGSSPPHAGGPVALAITRNGARAVARFAGGEIAVWNLDPAQGAIGQELSFAATVPAALQVSALIPGPDPASVVAGCAASDSLFRIDVAGAPQASAAGIGRRSHRLARSADGRTLWVGTLHGSPSQRDPVAAWTLGEAVRLAAISGPGQQAPPGGELPLPVRVQAVDASGRPQAGMIVEFALADTTHGSLDGAGRTRSRHVTGAGGEAAASWRMPGAPQPVTLSASLLGVPAATLAVAAEAVAAEDQAVPVVLEVGPPNGATGIHFDSPVYVRFSQRMNAVSVRSGIELTANGLPPPAEDTLSFELADQGRVVLLRRRALPFGAACTLRVHPGIEDLDGQVTASGTTSAFTVEPAPSLALVSTAPPAAAPGSPVVLRGEGFSVVPAQNRVVFHGGAVASVVTASTRALTVHVPAAAASGPLTVSVGGATSAPVVFTVLPLNPVPARLGDSVAVQRGIRHIAVSPDGRRAYVTHPRLNTVTALDLATVSVIGNVPVGVKPEGLAVLPDPLRVYVANTGSDDVAVIDADPGSPDYHEVVRVVPVGRRPTQVAVSPIGPIVLVVNADDSTLSVIDAQPRHGSFDRVVKSINLGKGGGAVTVAPDGGFAYVIAGDSILVIDLRSRVVVKSINLGKGGGAVTVAPDGTLLFVLGLDGKLHVIDLVPGSVTFHQVVRSINLGKGGGAVTVAPDGTLAYVTLTDGDRVLVFSIVKRHAGAGAASALPGTTVDLTLVETVPLADGPAGIAADPGGQFLLVGSEASGQVTLLSTVSPDTARLDLRTDRFRFADLSWVVASIEPSDPGGAAAIDRSSIRLAGTVPVDPAAPFLIVDRDGDSRPELEVSFPRAAVLAALPAGEAVPVTVSGAMGAGAFVARDTVRVRGGAVHQPRPGERVPRSAPQYPVRYDRITAAANAALLRDDPALRWRVLLGQVANTGTMSWSVPNQLVDSIRLAVVEVEQEFPDSTVRGMVALSGVFSITEVGAIAGLPAAIELAPVRPTPSRGAARVRFGLPRAAEVALEVVDVQGRRVAWLARGRHGPGWHEVDWRGRGAAAGLYFVRLGVEGREWTRRLVWLR